MITRIKIDGFKSFRNFQMEFSPLTVIAGMNAAGKSNLFDALHLLSRLAVIDLKKAFSGLRGEPIEQFTYYGDGHYADTMSFEVDLLVDRQVKDDWDTEAFLVYTRLRYSVTIQRLVDQKELSVINEWLWPILADDSWPRRYLPKDSIANWIPTKQLDYKLQFNTISTGGAYARDGGDGPFRTGTFEGTTAKRIRQTYLSGFNKADTPHFLAVREELRNWQFPTLIPEELSRPSPYYSDDNPIMSGENVAAVLNRIKAEDSFALRAIARKLTSLVPGLLDLDVIDDKANQQYVIQVKSQNERRFTSRVLSAGTLRLLALCILTYDETFKGVLAFEEPENGIHPLRIKDVMDLLNELCTDFTKEPFPLRQVIINTHSPVLVKDTFAQIRSQTVTVWLAQLVSQATTIMDKRIALPITKILPVHAAQTSIHYAEAEIKLTAAQVIKYLESAEAEALIVSLAHPNE